MLLSRLAETRIALVGTRSRNAKRDLIAAVLREASRDDVEIVVQVPDDELLAVHEALDAFAVHNAQKAEFDAEETNGEEESR